MFITDVEQRLDLNGLTIDCMRRLAADQKGWRNVTRRSCIIQIDDVVGADESFCMEISPCMYVTGIVLIITDNVKLRTTCNIKSNWLKIFIFDKVIG